MNTPLNPSTNCLVKLCEPVEKPEIIDYYRMFTVAKMSINNPKMIFKLCCCMELSKIGAGDSENGNVMYIWLANNCHC